LSAPRTVRRTPAGGDSHQHITRRDILRRHVLLARVFVVLDPFARTKHGLPAAGNEALHHVRLDAEGGRTLGRIENTEPAAGSGARIEQVATRPEGRGHEIDGAGDIGDCATYRFGHRRVLVVHQLENAGGRGQVDPGRARVALLGRERFQLFE
jgi:hypothetical protein